MLNKTKQTDKLLKGLYDGMKQNNIITKMDKEMMVLNPKGKLDSYRDKGKKAQTTKSSQKQTLEKSEKAVKGKAQKVQPRRGEKLEVYSAVKDNKIKTQIISSEKKQGIKLSEDSKKTSPKKSPKNHQARENILSFGPLTNIDKDDSNPYENPESDKKDAKSFKNGNKEAKESSKFGDAQKTTKSQTEGDDGNMSLHSYEDPEEDEKYYNEEELSKILGEPLDKHSKKAENPFRKPLENQHENTDGMDDESEYMFDQETIKYIQSLRDKFGFKGEIDPHEFLQKIQNELNQGVESSKQREALEELKHALQEELGQTPIELDQEDEIDCFEENEGEGELTPEEREFLLYQHFHGDHPENDIDYKNDLKAALYDNYTQDVHFEGYKDSTEQINPKETNFRVGPVPSTKAPFKQAEIIDSMKPQYYFNAKNKSLGHHLHLQDSGEDSKENTSKTPCFIGTPTSGSQLGSLNGTGAVRPEDLFNAMNNTKLTNKYHGQYISFSSKNSSLEKSKPPKGLQGSNPLLSFGGEENSAV